MDRALQFYVNVLGFTLVEQPEPRWACLRLGDLEIGLLKSDTPSPYLQRSAMGSRAGATVTLNSTNLQEDKLQIQKAGTLILSEETFFWGQFVVFEDTEGNVLRLLYDTDNREERLKVSDQLSSAFAKASP